MVFYGVMLLEPVDRFPTPTTSTHQNGITATALVTKYGYYF